MKRFLFLTVALFATSMVMAAEPLWLRYPSISPDGSKIAFTYMGDIYVVGAQGGEARLLVSGTAHDYSPIWSPDGKTIAFASDRHGNFDIFTVPAEGGDVKRVTTHSNDETPWTFSPDGTKIYFSGDLNTSAASRVYVHEKRAFLKQLYTVPVGGGRPQLIVPTVSEDVSVLSSGDAFLYHDHPSGEETWRKHHRSAAACDIWLCRNGQHTKLTSYNGEDRVPRISADDKTVYFLSERDGSFNVYSFPLDKPEEVTRHTFHKTHPVRSLSVAKNGIMCYTYDGQLYTKQPNGESQLLKISISECKPLPKKEVKVKTSNDATVSADGSQMVFAFRGELYATTTDDNKTTNRLTNTVATETEPVISPDGRMLVYVSERQGKWNLFYIELSRRDKNFVECKKVVEKPLIQDTKYDRRTPLFSPDGKELAFIEDRDRLMVMTLATGKVRQVTDGSHVTHTHGTYSYSWSADGKWIIFEGDMAKHQSDIGVVNASGKEPFVNMTRSGYNDVKPVLAAGGDVVVYLSERDGQFADSRIGGGSQSLYMLFLNRAAQERYTTPQSQHEALGIVTPKGDQPRDIVVEPQVYTDRVVRLTKTPVRNLIVDREGKYAYGIAKNKLVRVDLYKQMGPVKELGPALGKLAFDATGENIIVMGARSKKYNIESNTFSPISVSGTYEIDPAAEYAFMIDHMHNEMANRFYRKDLHGVDWTMYCNAYRRFAPHIANNHEFMELAGELLGELNVSHTGVRLSQAIEHKSHDVTGELGIFIDYNYTGAGLKVEEILSGGPFDRSTSKLAAGDVIEKIGGVELTPGMDYYPLLNRKAGKVVSVTIRKASGEVVEEGVLPIDRATYTTLLYQRWMARNAADVERLSGGKLAYVHMPANNGSTYPPFYSTVLGRCLDADALVVDIRYNAGGALHARLEEFFCGKQYLTGEVRGRFTKYMPRRRWIKPSAMLICSGCYSDGHGTPWVYDHLNMGITVGSPVPGTMTTCNNEKLRDPSMKFRMPIVGFYTKEGNSLENSQQEPDVLVYDDKTELARGRDVQLEAAIKVLLEEIKNPAKPTWKR